MTTPHRSDTPPSLSPESGTPAGEWAKETEGAIEQHALSKGATEASNTTATPARELPGAFPISQPPEVSSTSTKLGQTAKQSVEGVYMTAQNGVEGVYATAEHAARQYLPTSVVDKLEGVGVLREDTGFQETPLSTNDPESNTAPSQGSVGSLPGSKEPAGVAKVPEVSKKEVTEGGASMNPRIASPPAHSTNGPYPPSTESLVSPQSAEDTHEYTNHLSQSPEPLTDSRTTANPNGNMGRTISQQPASTAGSEETTNLSRNNQSPVTASPPPSPPRMGTLTSPDRDAQAAARVVVVETTRDTETNLKQGNNQVTQTKADTTHAHDTVSQAEGKDTTSSGTGSAVHVGDSEGAASVTGTENGKAGGHNKKLSFIQKLKGEAKSFAERMKTKKR